MSSLLGAPVAVEVPGGPGATVERPNREGAGAARAESVPIAGREVRADSVAMEPGRVVMIPVDRIVANRFQPRRRFEESGLMELSASIRAAGVVQPVLVRASPVDADIAGDRDARMYELVAGERRWRAAKLAGVKQVPAVVADLGDEQAAEWALIENVQRTDLSPMETAYALRDLCERFALTHAGAAEKLGLDRTSVTNLIRLTELEEEVRALLEGGALSAGHGKLLLSMRPGAGRVNLAKKAAESGWSVRRLGSVVGVVSRGSADGATAEEAVRANAALGGGDPSKGGYARESLAHAGMRELEKQLSEHLGTKVQIRVRPGGKRGSLLVQFYDLDHFDGLMGKMGFVMR